MASAEVKNGMTRIINERVFSVSGKDIKHEKLIGTSVVKKQNKTFKKNIRTVTCSSSSRNKLSCTAHNVKMVNTLRNTFMNRSSFCKIYVGTSWVLTMIGI